MSGVYKVIFSNMFLWERLVEVVHGEVDVCDGLQLGKQRG